MTNALAVLGVTAAMFVHTAGAVEFERDYATLRSDIVVRALTLIDTPYRFGGSTPETGFDCSGLVRYVFQSVGALTLPRRSEDIGKQGESITRSQLEPGDLVFFDTLSRAYSHVAIYIGDGRFLHAPARGGRVRIEALDDRYWRVRFNGARRFIDADARTLQAAAPSISSARHPPRFPAVESAEVIKP